MLYLKFIVFLIIIFYKIIFGILSLICIYFLFYKYINGVKVDNIFYYKFQEGNFFDKLKSFFFVIFMLIIIVLFSLIPRILNLGKVFDLYKSYINLKIFLMYSSPLVIIFNIILILNIIFLFMVLIFFMKILIYKHLLKIHIFFLRKETCLKGDNFTAVFKKKNNSYYSLVKNYMIFIEIIKNLPYNIIKPILPLLIGDDIKYPADHPRYPSKYFKLKSIISLQYHYYFIYILLLILFYDFIFHDLIITKVFYVLPFALIYYLMISLYNFFSIGIGNLEIARVVSFCFYLKIERYEKVIFGTVTGIYRFSNGYECEESILNDYFLKLY